MEKDKIVFKGSHPDSLYRVPMGGRVGASKIVRVLRILRWPVALFTVCIALAVFVYFLMPDNFTSDVEIVNATNWQRNNANAQTRRIPVKPTRKPQEHIKHTTKGNLRAHGTKPQEIDFYDAENVRTIDLTSLMETVTEKSEKIKNHVPPVFPTHITPEVQYGNEKADVNKIRTPKLLEAENIHDDESTLKPHITQSPERPLAIYFDEGKVAASTETITRAETNNDLLHYDEKETTRIAEELSSKPYSPVYKDTSMYIRKENSKFKQQAVEPDLPHEIQSYYRLTPLNPTNRFTSGHSKLFGISIEDAEKMKSTTQSSLYNTRVSPTLPTWRDRADSTTKNYPLNVNLDVSQCRSTRLALCRGVLPYDLAGPAVTLDGVVVTQLLPQIEYLVSTNCSDRVAQFLCALLEPECSPTPYMQRMPCYNLCRAVSESCEGSIPRELSGVFGCTRYPTSGCSAPRSPCGLRELTCNDGSCIPRHWSCDGAADCPSAEDEAHCAACAANEFRCNSGGCIRTRWICDGYSDCPGGEDEAEQVCGTRGREAYDEQVAEAESEPGEESAGSAPALAVRKPYHGSDTYAEELIHRNGEGDNSKELLITSDSSNSLKRNFTRRPSASRLTPYNRPLIHDYKAVQNDKADITVKRKPSEKKITSTTPPSTTNQMLEENLRETTVSESLGTHLDKSINNLERVINGAAMLKKAPEVIPEEITDSTESKMDIVEKTEEPRSHRGTGRYEDSVRAHASPCPSGELRCVDGRCITLAQLCDGTIDCSDHADEDNCYT